MRNQTQPPATVVNLEQCKNSTKPLEPDSVRILWKFWRAMLGLFADRWIAKNGAEPSSIWAATIGNLSKQQLAQVCQKLTERCHAGSTWPPDLAEFVALAAECSGGAFGLTVGDVLAENKRWRNEFYRYSCAETFDWRHPVLYHICIALKRVGIERKLTERELRSQAAKELERWEKRVESGLPIPPIRRQLAPPKAPPGPTPAELLYAEYKRKKGIV